MDSTTTGSKNVGNKYPVDEMRVERNPSLKQTSMDDDNAVATCKHLRSERGAVG